MRIEKFIVDRVTHKPDKGKYYRFGNHKRFKAHVDFKTPVEIGESTLMFTIITGFRAKNSRTVIISDLSYARNYFKNVKRDHPEAEVEINV